MRPVTYLKDRFKELPTFKKVLVVFVLLVLIGTSTWFGYLFGSKKLDFKNQALSPKGTLISGQPETMVPNPINGVLFKKSEADAWINKLPLAVMIENHTDARPQTGLSKADIVYEALAEGGITRFMAIFLQEDSDMGPVRSARPYYLDWATEYDSAYAHFGGSPTALGNIKNFGIKDLDGLSIGAPTFERSSKRPSPHNVYTTTQKLRAQADKKGYKKGADIVSWKFLDKEPKREERAAAIDLQIGFLGTFGYNVLWRYNPDTNSYFRFTGGAAHIDALTNSQLETKTIIVETVSTSPDPSGHSRLFMNTIGSGALKVFENGKVIEGSWKKDSRTARTQLLDSDGKDIKLNRGKIWVDIIPPGSTLTY